MRFRSNIYEFSQAARIVLAVLLMLYPVSIFASSVNTIDTISIAKSLGDVVNRVISETESSTRSSGYVIPMSVMADMLSANNRIVEILYNAGTAINMEQRTVTIKNFSRIADPYIHYRRMTYPPKRVLIYFCKHN